MYSMCLSNYMGCVEQLSSSCSIQPHHSIIAPERFLHRYLPRTGYFSDMPDSNVAKIFFFNVQEQITATADSCLPFGICSFVGEGQHCQSNQIAASPSLHLTLLLAHISLYVRCGKCATIQPDVKFSQ